MKRCFLGLAMTAWVTLPGCFLARETETFVRETGRNLATLDPVGLHWAYFGDLAGEATRAGAGPAACAGAADRLWAAALQAARPAPPVVLPAPAAPPPARVFLPPAAPAARPPARREVEEVGGGIVILREPDGRVVVTNRPGEF